MVEAKFGSSGNTKLRCFVSHQVFLLRPDRGRDSLGGTIITGAKLKSVKFFLRPDYGSLI